MKNNKHGGLSAFLSGKGFYAAMAVCLLGAVAAAWVSAGKVISSVNDKDDVPVPEFKNVSDEEYDPSESLFAAEDVGSPKEDVKIESEPEPEKNESTFNFFKKENSFVLPLSGEIIGKHSKGELVKYESLGEWRTHEGIDIAAETGTEVKAAADGKVLSVIDDPLWGTTVEIEHEKGIVTVYCGLSKEVPVKSGDEVKSGGVIGTLGETNLAETDKNSHLHFAMKENGKFIDPETKIK